MRPTVDEQLDGALRLLNRAASDPGISLESGALLHNAARLIARVSASWAKTLPFLLEDNARLSALMELPFSPPELTDVLAADRRNTELRASLAEVIDTLPQTGEGLATRARIVHYLRERAAADPS